MLLTALLIAQASAEWVEISQQHYRKPLRTYHFTTPAKITNVEETTKPRMYNNQSVSGYNWSRNIISTKNEHRDSIGEVDKNPVLTEHEAGSHEFVSTNNKFPNIGTVRRVQLSKSHVKSPNIKPDTNEKYPNIFYPDDETDSDREDNNMNRQLYNYGASPINDKNLYTTIRMPFLKTNKENYFNLNPSVNSSKNVHILTEDLNNNEQWEKQSQDKNAITTESIYRDVNDVPDVNETNHNGRPKKRNYQNLKTDEVTDNLYIESTTKDPIILTNQVHGNQLQKNQDLNSTKADSAKTIENLMRFMTVVTDTISKNSRRNFNGKIRYLQELKDSILGNIADRIDTTWPDDDVSGGARRRSRSAHAQGEPRGHVQFPSSESALMTISFLTFAVFLIKLVLQVIQTYKNKTMMVAPLVVAAAGRAAFARRHKSN